MNQKIKVKVVGATGYGGLGIIDLLLRHPCAEISALVAREDAGKRISDVYPHLAGFCDLPIYAADAAMARVYLWQILMPQLYNGTPIVRKRKIVVQYWPL